VVLKPFKEMVTSHGTKHNTKNKHKKGHWHVTKSIGELHIYEYLYII